MADVITMLRVRPDGWPSCCVGAKHPTSLTFSVAVFESLKSMCYCSSKSIPVRIRSDYKYMWSSGPPNHRGSYVPMVAACGLPTAEVGKFWGWRCWTGHALISCAGIVLLSETLSWAHLPTFGKFACL